MNQDAKWVRIAACESIALREGRSVEVAGRSVAIFNLGDRFLAVDNRCPHKGGPLAEGIVSGTTVVCPLHAWKVDVETGVVKNAQSAVPCIETFPTRVEAGVILVKLPAEAAIAPTQTTLLAEPDRPIHWIKTRIVCEGLSGTQGDR
jgi:nitrite reductase (NADH) small subunit